MSETRVVYAAGWQSKSALHGMLLDEDEYPDGPDQEAAMREIQCDTHDEAMAVLRENMGDMVYRTAQIRILRPVWNEHYGREFLEESDPNEGEYEIELAGARN
jgi:hypothetical protein